MNGVLCILNVILFISCTESAIQDGSKHHNDQTKDKVSTGKITDKDAAHVDHNKIYTEMFKGKRRDQALAIQSITNIAADKQRKFVEEVIKNIKKILEENRSLLERIGHKASAPFPFDSETLRESISMVLENIAFFSDLSVRFTRIVEKLFEKDRKLKTVIVWAYHYAVETTLLDPDTEKVLNLMAQQHQFIKRDETYVNPYDKTVTKEEIERIAAEEQQMRLEAKNAEKKASKKNKKTNSPKITKVEL